MSSVKKYLEPDYLSVEEAKYYFYCVDTYHLPAPSNFSISAGSGPVFTASVNDDPDAVSASLVFTRTSGAGGVVNDQILDANGSQTKTNASLTPGTYKAKSRFTKDILQPTHFRFYGYYTSETDLVFYAGTVENPVIDDGGVYAASKQITLSCDTAGATIRYTLDGSTPSASVGTVYTTPFTLTDDATIKAIAYKTDWISSSVMTESVTIIDDVTHTSTGTTTDSKINFSWNAVTADSYRIYYATTAGVWSGSLYVNILDGSASSYEFPGTPATTMYFRMAAVRNGTVGNLSTETSATGYDGVISNVQFDVASGTYEEAFDVVMSTTTPSGYIRFTLDGTNPTTSSGTLFEAGDVLHVDDTTVVKALAYKPGWTAGSVQTATYQILGIALLSAEQVSGQSKVALSWTPEDGADSYIVYWKTSSGVTASDNAIFVSSGESYEHTVDAGYTYYYRVAVVNDGEEGDLSNEVSVGVFMGAVATPQFGLASGAYAGQRSLTITSATSGASIRYTTDGSTPTATSGQIYAGALVLDASTNFKAIAYKTGYSNSSVAEASFTITNPVGAVASAVIPPSGNTAVTVAKDGVQNLAKVQADPVLAESSNWRWIMLVYLKSTGGKRFEGFDARSGTPQGIIKARDPAGTTLTLQHIFVVGNDRRRVKISRAELLNASQLDLSIGS